MRDLLPRTGFIDETSLKTKMVKTTGRAPKGARLIDHAPFGQSAPTLQPGDVIIPDNLSSNESPTAAAALKAVGAWFLFLPPYSPDLNPIETAFAKLKALIRRAAARTCDDLRRAVGQVCDLFTEDECYDLFKTAGYEID